MDTDSKKSLKTQLVVMLTHNDVTVENAAEIFNQCRDSQAQCWGMKEVGLPAEKMKQLYADMKAAGKTTFLEVVVYNEEDGIKGALLGAEIGCDFLMGTMFSKKIADICHENNMKYMPFVGNISGRPSVLTGSVEEIVKEAEEAVAAGADGIDILGYRHVDDPIALNKALCKALPGKICIAGSIDSYQRLDEVMETGAPLFTIGSAFFSDKFGGTFCEQINKVCEYLNA